ncbi:hypothetical protein C7S17_4589 [Burkholderia thailandensis]|nr:hypothetical protein [Burkholderia thailandensis]
MSFTSSVSSSAERRTCGARAERHVSILCCDAYVILIVAHAIVLVKARMTLRGAARRIIHTVGGMRAARGETVPIGPHGGRPMPAGGPTRRKRFARRVRRANGGATGEWPRGAGEKRRWNPQWNRQIPTGPRIAAMRLSRNCRFSFAILACTVRGRAVSNTNQARATRPAQARGALGDGDTTMLTPHELSTLLCIARSPDDVDIADPEFVSLVEMGLATAMAGGRPIVPGALLTPRGRELFERIACARAAAVQRI